MTTSEMLGRSAPVVIRRQLIFIHRRRRIAKQERRSRCHLKNRAVFSAAEDDDPAFYPNFWTRLRGRLPDEGYRDRRTVGGGG